MPLPDFIRVKISSEAGGYVSVTPVVSQEMRTHDLIEMLLALTGKNVERVHDLLKRGTLIAGASRFRWEGWEAPLDALQSELDSFPDSDASLPFSAEHCTRVVIRAGNRQVELTQQVGRQTRLFRRQNFWEELMALAISCAPAYVEYSYRERADQYQARLTVDSLAALQEKAALLRFPALRDQIRSLAAASLDLYTLRQPAEQRT